MKTKSIIKSLLLAAVVAAGLPTTAQQQAPMELAGASKANYRGEYKQGEVIVKFKDDAGVTVKVAKHGKRLMTTSVTSLNSKLQAIGLNTAEQLMPLTGAKKLSLNKAPRRGPSGKIVPEPDLSRLYLMTFKETPEKPMKDVVEQLKQIDQVEYAYPNYYVYAQSDGEASEADPMRTEQWYLDAIKLPQLWQMPKLEGAKRPVIAIIDTGVDITHPDLADNIWTNSAEASGATAEDDDQNGFVDDLHGWNFVQHNAVMEDRNGHGTHCAGIAAAVGNNGIGIAGANPDALIMPVTVMEPDGVGTAAVIIQGIDYAVANGADVLSMSFGSSSPWGYDIYQKAYQTAILAGAAGNAGQSIYRPGSPSGLSFPGAFDIVLGVQASNEQNTQAGFSNFDPDGPYYVNSDWYGSDWWNYEIWAPGQNILSTYPGGTYKSMNGTSMATPLVAGAISRLLQTKEPEYYRDVWIGDIVAAKAQDSIIVMDDYRSGTEYATSIFDAMAAYNFDYSNRKARLSIPLVEIDDTEGGDGDGIIDAGETIKLWPTLRSEWGLANNVTFSVMANPLYESASNVEVLENNVDFGYSLNRASLRSKNPLVIKVSDDVDDSHILKLRVTATCDNIINDVEQDVEFKVENIAELQSVITEDMTLYPDKHYVVKKSIAIPQGVTLTIMPGTRIEFAPGCYLQSEGKLIANGKPDSLIVFTSRDPNSTWGGIRSHAGSNRDPSNNYNV
ncbi:MAG: S8 family serine peptidase [Muribaculaceae bacterium]|nr:S8 family serine peptidase [Muribaculaceae bacterium]